MNNRKRGSFNDIEYYKWLVEKVGANRPPYLNYLMLLQTLHKKPFMWVPCVPMDSNRLMDAYSMKLDYSNSHGFVVPVDEDGDIISPSVLEVLVALSIRIDSEIMGEPGIAYPEKWFWIMIGNLGLMDCTDDRFDKDYVEQKLDIWLERRFDFNGNGSIFPLKKAFSDQRYSEIWQQMQDYLNETCSSGF